jgi:hypothetical protein
LTNSIEPRGPVRLPVLGHRQRALEHEVEEQRVVPHEAAARQQLKKKRPPRLEWAGLLRRTFTLDTFRVPQLKPVTFGAAHLYP